MTLRRRKGPGTSGDLVAISEPNIILIDSESSNVTRIGTWSRVEESEAVGGSYLQSNVANSKLTFSFRGSTLWIRFRFGPDCGKVKVEVDDSVSVTIDLYYALEVYKYVNVAVGLKETEEHNTTLTVLGEKNASSTDYYVKVDSFAYRLTEEALSLHSIEYIDLINVINTINRINEIRSIANIERLVLTYSSKGIENPGFETGKLDPWEGNGTIDSKIFWNGKYSLKIQTFLTEAEVWQNLKTPILLNDINEFYVYLTSNDTTNKSFEIRLQYDDFSLDVTSVNVNFKTWKKIPITFSKNKILTKITFALLTTDKTVWVDDVTLKPLTEVASVTKFLPLTSISAGGTLDVWVPTSGKKIRLKRFQISVSGATGITLQWSGATSVTDFEHYVLPDKGTVVVNLVGCNEIAPEADAVLRIKSSASAFVTCKASGDEIC